MKENDEIPKRYTLTRTLKAWPRSRAEYCRYRGQDVPSDEDPDEMGYMIEYEDVREPNMSNHEGYVSWSNTRILESLYREEPADWRTRAKIEYGELRDKIEKLNGFMASPAFTELPALQRELLILQRAYMAAYANVLNERLK